MLTFCTQWRFLPSKRRYQLYSTIKLVRYYPNTSWRRHRQPALQKCDGAQLGY